MHLRTTGLALATCLTWVLSLAAPSSASLPHTTTRMATPPVIGSPAGAFRLNAGTGPTSAPAIDPAVASASHLPVRHPEVLPISAHGKLLISIGGGRASCSATVINTPNASTVISAAHCVREGFGNRGRWARRVVFIPAFDRGKRPYGSYIASRLWVPSQYWSSQNPNFDVALIRVRPNRLGRVARVVGARGWAAGISRQRRYTIYGYPGAAMRGERPRKCRSRVHGVRQAAKFIPGPAPSRVFCDMARGASGGGWVYGRGILNGVTGYANLGGRRGVIFGPYFGNEIQRMIQSYG